jgi:hypothetical protein
MYRSGPSSVHLQYYRTDTGQFQFNVWYRLFDDAGHEELSAMLSTVSDLDGLIDANKQDSCQLGMDPDQYRLMPVPPEWEQRIAKLYGS